MRTMLAIGVALMCLVMVGAAVPVFESSGSVRGNGQGVAWMSNPYVPYYYNYGGPVTYYYSYQNYPNYYSYWFWNGWW